MEAGRSRTEVTAGLTVVVTVREVSGGDGPAERPPTAQSGSHQPGTVARLTSLATGGGGGGGGGGGAAGGMEEAGRVGVIDLPIISYLEHNNNTPLGPHSGLHSAHYRIIFLRSAGRRN